MKTKKKKITKWKDEFYVTSFDLARDGHSNFQIAKIIGVDKDTYKKWVAAKPALQDALDRARSGKKEGAAAYKSFKNFVYDQLPTKLKELWDEIDDGLEQGGNRNKVNKALKILSKAPVRMKQHFYLYALFHCDFSTTEACRRCGIDLTLPRNWAKTDPEFGELLTQIHECKKDFFESALIKLVRSGDTSAILFANRTLNRDRGYHDKIDVSVSGEITHKVEVEDLNLPIDVQRQLLEAVRNRGQKALPAPKPQESIEAIDVDFEEVEK